MKKHAKIVAYVLTNIFSYIVIEALLRVRVQNAKPQPHTEGHSELLKQLRCLNKGQCRIIDDVQIQKKNSICVMKFIHKLIVSNVFNISWIIFRRQHSCMIQALFFNQMVAHFTLSAYGVNQVFLFVKSKKSSNPFFFFRKDLISLYVRNMFLATILYKYHGYRYCTKYLSILCKSICPRRSIKSLSVFMKKKVQLYHFYHTNYLRW